MLINNPKKRKNSALMLKHKIYQLFYDRLTAIALNSFEYENMPETVNLRYLELTLLNFGKVAFFKNDIDDLIALQCYNSGNLDIYGEPINFIAHAVNGTQFNLTNKDGVIMYSNYTRDTPIEQIDYFAMLLSEIQITMFNNLKQQKKPYIIACEENTKLSVENILKQIDEDEIAILTSKYFNIDSLKVLKTDSVYIGDKLTILKNQVWNEALTYLGVENSNQDKKERLVADEVGSNYGNVEAQRNIFLKARTEAIDKINKMFKLNIKVRFNSNLSTMLNQSNLTDDLIIQNFQVKDGVMNG